MAAELEDERIPTTILLDSPRVEAADDAASIRVLHVVEAFGGGVFEQIRHLTKRLSGLGVTTGVAYGERPETPPDVADLISPEVMLFPLPWTSRTVGSQLRTGLALSRLYEEWRPDVVHLHSSFAGVLGAITVPRSIPTIYTPHGYSFTMADRGWLARTVFGTVEKLVSSRITAIGAVSHSEADLAASIATRSKVFVVNNGVPELDSVAIRPRSAALDRPIVVAMGRLAPQHRPHETVAILRQVADIADVLWIGDGRTPADRVPLEEAGIPLTGWLPRDEAVECLQRADVYVHWAAWDGQPLSVLEAMAVDSIVIGSDIPPLRDMIPDAQRFCGTEEAATAIRAILTDQDLHARCLASQDAIRRLFSANSMAERWASAYRDLVQGDTKSEEPRFDVVPNDAPDAHPKELSRA